MDRGYLDFARLHRFASAGTFFVIRAKRNLDFRRRSRQPVDRVTGLRSEFDHPVEGRPDGQTLSRSPPTDRVLRCGPRSPTGVLDQQHATRRVDHRETVPESLAGGGMFWLVEVGGGNGSEPGGGPLEVAAVVGGVGGGVQLGPVAATGSRGRLKGARASRGSKEIHKGQRGVERPTLSKESENGWEPAFFSSLLVNAFTEIHRVGLHGVILENYANIHSHDPSRQIIRSTARTRSAATEWLSRNNSYCAWPFYRQRNRDTRRV